MSFKTFLSIFFKNEIMVYVMILTVSSRLVNMFFTWVHIIKGWIIFHCSIWAFWLCTIFSIRNSVELNTLLANFNNPRYVHKFCCKDEMTLILKFLSFWKSLLLWLITIYWMLITCQPQASSSYTLFLMWTKIYKVGIKYSSRSSKVIK